MVRDNRPPIPADWKSELIRSRARRLGRRGDEVNEAHQRIFLDVAAFNHDSKRSNGASKATALTAVIDNRLRNLRRAEKRYVRHLRELWAQRMSLIGPAVEECPHLRCRLLAHDLQCVLARLSTVERAVCEAMALGRTPSAIARDLGLDRRALARIVGQIREIFAAHDLDAWLQEG
jgi:hypothetical protein